MKIKDYLSEIEVYNQVVEDISEELKEFVLFAKYKLDLTDITVNDDIISGTNLNDVKLNLKCNTEGSKQTLEIIPFNLLEELTNKNKNWKIGIILDIKDNKINLDLIKNANILDFETGKLKLELACVDYKEFYEIAKLKLNMINYQLKNKMKDFVEKNRTVEITTEDAIIYLDTEGISYKLLNYSEEILHLIDFKDLDAKTGLNELEFKVGMLGMLLNEIYIVNESYNFRKLSLKDIFYILKHYAQNYNFKLTEINTSIDNGNYKYQFKLNLPSDSIVGENYIILEQVYNDEINLPLPMVGQIVDNNCNKTKISYYHLGNLMQTAQVFNSLALLKIFNN